MWEKYLHNYNIELFDDEDKFLLVKDSLIIFNIEASSSCDNWIKTFLKNGNKILLLQNIPEFSLAKRYLESGIHGYGNSMMSEAFLNSAVMSILEGFIWIHPQFTQHLIQNISNNNSTNSDILNKLTQKEKQTALLVCEGLNNIEISKKLNVSINTVKTHLKNIYEKLNVKDRLSLVILLK
jgi:DNA-binding NarL/FixJ family response regulator